MEEDRAGERIDVALAGLSGSSRAQIRRWIDAGRVQVNGLPVRPSLKVEPGDEIEAAPPELVAALPEPEAIPLSILYEDSSLIVIDKPAGLVVHPAPGHPRGTLVNALLHHCDDLAGVGGVLRPGIVHRLDRGTSGVMVAAKNDIAHQGLSELFREHDIERRYRAFVRGTPSADEGEMDRAIGRHPSDRKRMSVKTRAGREAKTRWHVSRRYPASDVSALDVFPETGRTHQIRVHLSSSGMPIIGDPVYGRGQRRGRAFGLERPALHAAVLGFRHPESGEELRFESPLAPDLEELVRSLERAEGPA